MAEYIIETQGLRKIELTRCRDCVLASVSQQAPFLMVCGQWQKLVPRDGYCHLGEKGIHNGQMEK